MLDKLKISNLCSIEVGVKNIVRLVCDQQFTIALSKYDVLNSQRGIAVEKLGSCKGKWGVAE